MIEKLLENWLDNASERSYQAVFVQILSGKGFQVIHSTRHDALEFGKDILAIDPGGSGCAYQLKGNPGGRLKLSAFRNEVQPQLVQLMSQSVIYPGFPKTFHKSYLVTNGFFDEEVQVAVESLNKGPYPSKVELISRGNLLEWCKELGTNLWPSELRDVRQLLELVLTDPKDLLPKHVLAGLLGSVLALEPKDSKLLKRDEFSRRTTSAALLTGIGTAHFSEEKNHWAVASAWTLFAVMLIGAAERHGHETELTVVQTLALAEGAILDALADLWSEVSSREHLAEGSALSEPEVSEWRLGVLRGTLSCLAFSAKEKAILSDEEFSDLKKWLLDTPGKICLWGEGAIANIVPWLLFKRQQDPTLQPDLYIAAITRAVTSLNQTKSHAALPSAYYDFIQIFRFTNRTRGSIADSAMERDTFAGSAYSAEALLHLLVRTNLKQMCKSVWPNFTRLQHRRLELEVPWHYCLLNSSSGCDETKIYPRTYEWEKLKADATKQVTPCIPKGLLSRPWLLALWWQVAPHRFNSESSRYIAEAIIPNWGS